MNHTILIGRLVRDPELKFISNSGKATANFTIAVDRNLSKEKKAELQEKGQPTADFIRVIAWGKLAETCANYLSKGKQVAINGSIQTSTYKTNTGETRYATDVLANSVEFLGGGDGANNHNRQEPMSGGGSDEYSNNGDFASIDEDSDCPF